MGRKFQLAGDATGDCFRLVECAALGNARARSVTHPLWYAVSNASARTSMTTLERYLAAGTRKNTERRHAQAARHFGQGFDARRERSFKS